MRSVWWLWAGVGLALCRGGIVALFKRQLVMNEAGRFGGDEIGIVVIVDLDTRCDRDGVEVQSFGVGVRRTLHDALQRDTVKVCDDVEAGGAG